MKVKNVQIILKQGSISWLDGVRTLQDICNPTGQFCSVSRLNKTDLFSLNVYVLPKRRTYSLWFNSYLVSTWWVCLSLHSILHPVRSCIIDLVTHGNEKSKENICAERFVGSAKASAFVIPILKAYLDFYTVSLTGNLCTVLSCEPSFVKLKSQKSSTYCNNKSIMMQTPRYLSLRIFYRNTTFSC